MNYGALNLDAQKITVKFGTRETALDELCEGKGFFELNMKVTGKGMNS